MSDEVQAELLVGRTVHDADGNRIGRVADIVAHRDEEDALVVKEYLVGPRGWLHRFAVHGLGLRLRRLAWVYRVPWDLMDLQDPRRPRATCRRDELKIEDLPPRKRGLARRPGRQLA